MARIALDARLTHYRVGGISSYIKGLVAAFEAEPPPHDLTILRSRKAKNGLSGRFGDARMWTPPHHLLERYALSLELLPRGLDLLHSPDFIAPLRGAKRHVITVHDLSFFHFPQYITPESYRYYNRQIRASVNRADAILVPSQATETDLIDILKVPADKICVHREGVSVDFRPLSRSEIKPTLDALGLPAAYLLCVGTLEPRKNLVNLALAYRALLSEQPDAPQLVLAGSPGWHYERLMRDIAAVGVDGNLIVLHNVSDAQLPALYNGALAAITPSLYEGFGLPALEAMACGTAPIVSDVSSLPEIVGDVGALVDPNDVNSIAAALKLALCDSAWRAKQAIAGIKRAKLFRWSETAAAVRDVYQAALN